MKLDADYLSDSDTPVAQAMMGVFALYWQIDQKIDQRLAALEAHNGLGRIESHMLLILHKPRRMGDLARLTLKSPSAVTAASDVLVKLGMVLKERDQNDRRSWLLRLTEQGESCRDAIKQAAETLFYETSGLTEDETVVFAELAQKIHMTAIKAGLGAACVGDEE